MDGHFVDFYDKSTINPLFLKNVVNVADFKQSCSKQVSQNYYNDSITGISSRRYLALYYKPGDNALVHSGFSTFSIRIDEDQKSFIYIDVICSNVPSGGIRLINAITAFGQENGCSLIELKALPHVIDYYKQHGFIESDYPCDHNPTEYRYGDEYDGFRMTRCIESRILPYRTSRSNPNISGKFPSRYHTILHYGARHPDFPYVQNSIAYATFISNQMLFGSPKKRLKSRKNSRKSRKNSRKSRKNSRKNKKNLKKSRILSFIKH